ncbi:MAG TPA: UbiA-like polyprenyltransferase [Phycisphaerae bacterium]|nr:UbiA-like polyprenyltransferase [Phycisphaerae bacterium]
MTTAPATSSTPTPAGRLATFLDLIKFAHSIFALPFALIATFWASRAVHQSWPGLGRLLLIIACMVIARTFAMTFNRLIDRRFDAANPRTARRPSVTGAVTVSFMRSVLVTCMALFLVATAGFWWAYGNFWPLVLSLPVLAWLGGYSLTKRFTALCHFWLGASLGLAPVSAWIAIAPPAASPGDPRGITAALLGVGVLFWVAGFDILYALQDEDFDRNEHLHSIPAAVGRRKALLLSRGCHLLTAIAFAAVGVTGGFHLLYWAGYFCAVVLLAIEQSLVSERDISKINIAFMTANGLIGLVFGALAVVDTLLM